MIEVLAIVIPLDFSDQYKLLGLVRKIPAALERTEIEGEGEKRTYSFPKMDDKGFKINCSSTHFHASPVPSEVSCTLSLLEEADPKFDEHKVEFRDPFVVKSLYDAISYGQAEKHFFSSERVYGFSLNQKYQDIFRYFLTCSKEKCSFSMSSKISQ
jgi:hypothetical protein